MKSQFKLSGVLAVCFTVGLCGWSQGDPEGLTDADRKECIERLEEMREVAERSSKDRFARALGEFREAIKSDAAAHELYLKCVEKVNFIDEKKGSQEFREWKRKHKEKKDTVAFRRALRHQLNWLLLSIEACVKPDELDSFGVKALEKMGAIMDDHDVLKPEQGLLKKNVLSSVYAKAYDIHGLEAKGWPLSPLEVGDIYDKVVMPPLRNVGSVSRLRVAWEKRIEHEGMTLKNWADLPDSNRVGMKKDLLPPEFEKWKEDGYLQLLWDAEMDCYEAGDEVESASNMLTFLAKYIKHKKSLEWTEEFQELMSSGVKGDESDTSEQAAEVSGAGE